MDRATFAPRLKSLRQSSESFRIYQIHRTAHDIYGMYETTPPHSISQSMNHIVSIDQLFLGPAKNINSDAMITNTIIVRVIIIFLLAGR